MITLVEVLTQPLKMGNSTLEMEYRNILMRSRHFSLLPISVGIAERAAQLRAHYNLKHLMRFRYPLLSTPNVMPF